MTARRRYRLLDRLRRLLRRRAIEAENREFHNLNVKPRKWSAAEVESMERDINVTGARCLWVEADTTDLPPCPAFCPPKGSPNMTPIPSYLADYSWYAPHLANLVLLGRTPRHDPGTAEPARANLIAANLTAANLTAANLRGANLTDAKLVGADLTRANLTDAKLVGADLADANLSDANLTGANLTGATMPDGRLWEEWLADPLAGVCQDEEVKARALAAWGNHDWSDCPMHEAYGWKGLHKVPEDQRLHVAAWIAVYDAWLFPSPQPTTPTTVRLHHEPIRDRPGTPSGARMSTWMAISGRVR